MKHLLARGPVVDALKRHDPGLRVRWSHEKQRWAVDAPYKRFDKRVQPAPVRYERVGTTDQYIEHLLPENSERYIQYHDERYVICWSKVLDWRLYRAILTRDSHMGSGALKKFDQALYQAEKTERQGKEKRAEERAYEGFDLYKYLIRKYPDPIGAGVSDRRTS